jgi:hypothetical protein
VEISEVGGPGKMVVGGSSFCSHSKLGAKGGNAKLFEARAWVSIKSDWHYCCAQRTPPNVFVPRYLISTPYFNMPMSKIGKSTLNENKAKYAKA